MIESLSEIMSTIIGLDIGTSSIKAVLVDARQQIVAEATHHIKTNYPQEGFAEQDPYDWIASTTAALTELRSQSPDLFQRCSAIGLTGQMHGAVLLGADRKPLRPAILWNDSRASKEAAQIQVQLPQLALKAGVQCMASFVAPKLLWIERHEPSILKQLRHLILPKDFVRHWLTGELATDMVDAAGAWFLDQERRCWSKDILSALSIEERVLPRLMEGNEISGEVQSAVGEEIGLTSGIPVVAGCGDAAAGGIGLGYIEENESFISLGTSTQLFITRTHYKPRIKAAVHTFAHGLPGLWFQMAAMLNGASVLSWWANVTGKEPGMLLKEAEEVSREGSSVLFLPYLSGERTPHNNPNLRGSFYGIAANTSRPELTKAIIEGIAFTLADACDAVCLHRSQTHSLGLVGGGAQSDLWAQIISNVLGLPIVRYQGSRSGPAFGATRLARIAIEGREVSKICIKPEIDRVFEPESENCDRYREQLNNWRSFCEV